MPIETGEVNFRTEVLSTLRSVKQSTETLTSDVNEIKDDIHEMKREVYPRLTSLEKHQAVMEEREKHRSSGEQRTTTNKDKIVIALLLFVLMGAAGFVWKIVTIEPEQIRDGWQERGR